MWTEIAPIAISFGALGVAAWAALHTRNQADMAADQARFAGTQADAAKEQVVAAKEQVDIAVRQLELAEQVRREQIEPYIMVDIQPSPHMASVLLLVIENIGPTVARNVRIKFDPQIERFADQSGPPVLADAFLFTEGIPFMPPSRRIELFFDIDFKRVNSDLPMRYTVTVDCDGPLGPVETLTYKIDMGILLGTERITVKNLHDGVKELEKLRNELVKAQDATTKAIREASEGQRGG